jgi:hypothetical protein
MRLFFVFFLLMMQRIYQLLRWLEREINRQTKNNQEGNKRSFLLRPYFLSSIARTFHIITVNNPTPTSQKANFTVRNSRRLALLAKRARLWHRPPLLHKINRGVPLCRGDGDHRSGLEGWGVPCWSRNILTLNPKPSAEYWHYFLLLSDQVRILLYLGLFHCQSLHSSIIIPGYSNRFKVADLTSAVLH